MTSELVFCLPKSFATDALKIMSSWWLAQNPTEQNCKTFAIHPALTLPVWIAVYQWAVGGAEAKDGNNAVFYIWSSSRQAKLVTLIKKKKSKERHKNWKSLDDFVESQNSVWEVKNLTKEYYLYASCTCSQWLKHRVCKDSLGLAIRLQYCTLPCPRCPCWTKA